MMVVGLEADLSRFQHLPGLVRIVGPTFVECHPNHGPSLRAADFGPFDGRAGVQDHPVLQSWDDLPGWSDVHQHGLSLD